MRLSLPSGLFLVCGLLLSACQTDSATRAQREGLTRAAGAIQYAMNARSVAALEPFLAPGIQFQGMPPELSLHGLRSGVFWPRSRVDGFALSNARNTPDGPEAKVTFNVGPGMMLLKLGLDPTGRIRSIDDELPWWSSPVSVPRAFTSDIVISNRLMFVRGSVNGTDGFLLLDTGASGLLLNYKYFTPAADDTSVGISSSITGERKRLGRAEVSSLRWGGLRAGNIAGELHDFSGLETRAVTPLLGAISHDELKDCAISIDWRHRKVQVFALNRDGSKKMKSTDRPPDVQIHFSNFSFFPMIPVTIGEKRYSLLFDSGASLNVLPDAEGVGHHLRGLRPITIRGASRSGGLTSLGGIVDEMRMGGVVLRDMPFVIHDTPFLSGKGFLGVPLLERYRVEINFPARQMSLWR